MHVRVYSAPDTVSEELCKFLIQSASDAIRERGIFTLAVSGGSLAKPLCDGLSQCDTDWSKWRMFFCDERHVAFDDPECTYSLYKKNLMSRVPLSDENVFPDNPLCSVEEAASEYSDKLKGVFGDDGEFPRFDVMLLGLGPDGHTCSLFPGHPLLQEKTAWVAAIRDSPKPPPQRITLTLPVLQNSRAAVFVCCGAGKADIVKRVLQGNEDPALPAALVQPHSGDLYWFLDAAAARLTKYAQSATESK